MWLHALSAAVFTLLRRLSVGTHSLNRNSAACVDRLTAKNIALTFFHTRDARADNGQILTDRVRVSEYRARCRKFSKKYPSPLNAGLK